MRRTSLQTLKNHREIEPSRESAGSGSDLSELLQVHLAVGRASDLDGRPVQSTEGARLQAER